MSPVTLNFGSVLVGDTATLPIQVTNASPNPATFGSITATGDYTVSSNCPSSSSPLAPGASCTLQIAFTPTQTGVRSGTVSIATSLTSLALTAQLLGTGVQSQLQVTPSSLSFSSIAIGASASKTLSLSNTGTAAITGLSLSITGDYAITTPCSLTALAPGASCAVTITFTPTAAGARTGALTITGSGQTSATVPLTGTGMPNASFTFTVNGGTSASVTVKSGQPATYPLTLTPQNGFTGPVVFNCTPINPGQYATCSLLPSSVNITSSSAQNSTATINTVTEVTSAANQSYGSNGNRYLACIVPVVLAFSRKRRFTFVRMLAIALFSVIFFAACGCGSGGYISANSPDPNLRYTPPGDYQYQVTATSTTGAPLTQTVTLNLAVTAQ